ncbi:DNA/RNA helicase [Peribacillus saganii]|uniref:DNA/RNA helicase n=1 Tax=Peribacillus saganii TaxID=2303992 RepID=A0A372LMF3_9BACI|nr:DNA/RNA helicase [Peribacillus saganii]
MKGATILQKFLQKILRFSSHPLIPSPEHKILAQSYSFSPELQHHLSGRALLAEEISFPADLLDEHFQCGYIGRILGVSLEDSKFQCNRCGNQNQNQFFTFPCSRCKKDCTYCRNCIMMGRVSSCSYLHVWTGPDVIFESGPNPLAWTGSLSEGQSHASDRVVDAVTNKEQLLVWAVCGAGKTEVLFKGIEAGLQSSQRICIATPRNDVVLELVPRLKKAFPDIAVASLYGGTVDRHLLAPLTVSTTHQLFRFYKAFDTVIIDEVDAFPYSADKSLQFAVDKARKSDSSLIYLTATPSAKMQFSFTKGSLKGVTIPARFHRKPIPVPIMKWCGNWNKSISQNKTIPPAISAWVKKRLENNTPILLFFPSIKIMENSLPIYQKLNPDLEAVHSEDPERKTKVSLLREKRIPGLLTTTILERGVTIPNLEVAVIGADHDVFSESALVQIAGRVGRSIEKPDGNVTFFHYGKSNGMVRAVRHIERMNAEAEKRGMLDV